MKMPEVGRRIDVLRRLYVMNKDIKTRYVKS